MSNIKDLLATNGKRQFIPNVKVFFKETMYIPPAKQNRFANPLYGGDERRKLIDNELDERAYERTVLRYSPFFERMRGIRANVSASGPLILGETKVNDIPDFRTREVICDGMLDCGTGGAEARKWLCIPEEGVFEFSGSGKIRIQYKNLIIPDFFLENGRTTCTTVSPLTDGFTDYGANGRRLNRFFTAENITENLTAKGGAFSLSYTSSADGIDLEKVDISVAVYPV